MQMSIVAFATSCGVPVRREGHNRISSQDLIACCTSGGRPTNTPPSTRLAGPKMTPGLSKFTVIPRLARATAKQRTRDSMAAFADPIPTQGCQLPDRAPGEWVMAMIRPPLSIKGAANWAPNKKAVACELMACCHCSTLISMGFLLILGIYGRALLTKVSFFL